MTPFTVIGFWPDTLQRFCTNLVATSADAAEVKCLSTHPGLAICAVIGGVHAALDSANYVNCELH